MNRYTKLLITFICMVSMIVGIPLSANAASASDNNECTLSAISPSSLGLNGILQLKDMEGNNPLLTYLVNCLNQGGCSGNLNDIAADLMANTDDVTTTPTAVATANPTSTPVVKATQTCQNTATETNKTTSVVKAIQTAAQNCPNTVTATKDATSAPVEKAIQTAAQNCQNTVTAENTTCSTETKADQTNVQAAMDSIKSILADQASLKESKATAEATSTPVVKANTTCPNTTVAVKTTATPTSTAEPTAAPVATAEPTATPEATAKTTATPVATAEPTATPVATAKPTATPTPAPATPTPTPVATATPTPAPTSTSTGTTASSYAAQVVTLVNQERAKEGLAPLTVDVNLQKAAQTRAVEIKTSFSHTRPNGTTCFTAIKEAGVTYRTAGENIAYGQRSPEQVMAGWMNSEGHRANIMNGSFTKIGVGVYQDSNGIYYWTQEFIG